MTNIEKLRLAFAELCADHNGRAMFGEVKVTASGYLFHIGSFVDGIQTDHRRSIPFHEFDAITEGGVKMIVKHMRDAHDELLKEAGQ